MRCACTLALAVVLAHATLSAGLNLRDGKVPIRTEARGWAGGQTSARPQFLKSDSLGITHCRLPGVLGEEDVVLHVWLRVVPPAVTARSLCAQRWPPVPFCNRTAIARGFALIQSARKSIPYFNRAGIQLLQAASLLLFSQQVHLRSYTTGIEYPLRVTMPFVDKELNLTSHTNNTNSTSSHSQHPIQDHSQHHRQGHSQHQHHSQRNDSHATFSGPKFSGQGWTSHMVEVGGLVALQDEREDLDQEDFELRVGGFDWYCPVLVERPVLGNEEAPPSSQQTDGDGDGDDGPAGLAPAAAAAAGGWRHHTASSLSNRTQAWQVLSPFHSMNVHNYAVMLWHRVLWHARMGVTHYLLYVYESLSPLLREPLIQELVSRGVLHVVLYVDMPKHEEQLLQPTLTDTYLMQVLAYNHALLALWGSDSLVLVADVDEYLITPKPMSVVQLYTACRNETVVTPPWFSLNVTIKAWMLKKRPLAGLQVRRTDAVCAPDATPSQCSPQVPGLAAWLGARPGDVATGRQAHPLTWHGMTDGRDLWGLYNVKMLVDPNLARDFHVHFFARAPGALREQANTSCVRLLHLVDLYRVRHRDTHREGRPAEAFSESLGDEWWWPAHELARGEGELVPRWAGGMQARQPVG